MKICLLYAAWNGEGWSTPIGFRNELERRGNEIRHYNLYHDDGRLNPRDNLRHFSAEGLNKFATDFRRNSYCPDVVYVMDYGQFDCPAQDKQYFPGTVWIMEAGDEPQTFRMNAMKARKFHGVLTPDKQCATLYNNAGIPAEWATHHADHHIFHPYKDVEVTFDCVSTCGEGRGNAVIGNTITQEISDALGDRVSFHRYYYGESHPRRLCEGKMVFQCSQWGEVTRRIFEGMACGKMVITDRLSDETGLSDLFEDEVDIVYYDSAQDAIEKIRYYAEHDDERFAIAENGYRKVLEGHTVVQRADQFEEFYKKLSTSVLAS
jgi:hypothetical protein